VLLVEQDRALSTSVSPRYLHCPNAVFAPHWDAVFDRTVRLQVRVRKQGGMTMFRKLTIALIATAALSIAVFAPTSASAWEYSGWHRGGGGYRGWATGMATGG